MDASAVYEAFENLPPLLKNSWLLDPRLEVLNEEELRGSGITTSELCKRYLKYRLAQYSARVLADGAGGNMPSLVNMAARKIRSMLAQSEDLDEELDTLLKTVNSTLLRYIFGSPESPYVLLRSFMTRAQVLSRRGIRMHGMNLFDIDEMVLQNGRFLRFSVFSDKFPVSEEYTVGFESLRVILGDDPNDMGEILSFRRQDPPKGGFEMLDQLRPRILQVIKDDVTYRQAFDWVTHDVLKHLNWSNILAAGPLVLTVLMLTEPSRRLHKRLGVDMIDLYLYGLSAREAQSKLEHICITWKASLQGMRSLVAKHPHSMTLSTEETVSSIRIHFRLYRSPIHVLLGQDLDPLAIGYDGHQVRMLPRCARALETGYSTFTTDLIHGDADLGRLPTLLNCRMLKLAKRGFGLRILPLYLLSLGSSRGFFDERERKISTANPVPRHSDPAYKYAIAISEPRCVTCGSHDARGSTTHERYRKPTGNEPGLKTLKRVAFLGRNYVDRFFFRDAPREKASILDLSRLRPNTLREEGSYGIKHQAPNDQGILEAEDQGQSYILPSHGRHTNAWNHDDMSAETLQVCGKRVPGPYTDVIWLQKSKSYLYNASRESLDHIRQFEAFMRHAEVWRLHVSGYVTVPCLIDSGRSINFLTAQDGIFSSYLPSDLYGGLEPPSPGKMLIPGIMCTVDTLTQTHYHRLQEAICSRLGIPLTRSGYRGYLTRRIRLAVHGSDFYTAIAKPLSIPLTIPKELEDYIHDEFLPSIPNLPPRYTHRPTVTIIHDVLLQNDSAVLPSLHDTDAETGNLRYWVIDDNSIWAGQHPIVDELFALYKAIFRSQSAARHRVGPAKGFHSPPIKTEYDASDPNFILILAHFLKDRIVPPDRSFESYRSGSIIHPTEKLLFQAWILSDPGRCEGPSLHPSEDRARRREPFDQDDYPYPVPDSLFWTQGDEGQEPSDFVPEWRSVPRADSGMGDLIKDSIRRDDTRLGKLITKDTDLGFAETQVTFDLRAVTFDDQTFASLEEDLYSGTDEDEVDDYHFEGIDSSSDGEGFW